MFDIKLDESKLRKLENNLESLQNKIPQITKNAINRSLEMVRTEQMRRSAEQYNVKIGKLRETTVLKRASNGNLVGGIVSRGSVIGLDHFKLTPKTRGKRKKTVKVAVKKGSVKALPNAFIAYHDGRLGAFQRVGEKSLPIKRLMGPSAPQMLGEISILGYLEGYAEEKFNMRFEHEMERLLK